MAITLSARTPVARKMHSCDTCGTTIVVGERYSYAFRLGDDGAFVWKSCEPCDDLMLVVWNWLDDPYEGVSDEDFADWAEDHTDDPDHGDAARAFLTRKHHAHQAWVARMNAAHGEGLW